MIAPSARLSCGHEGTKQNTASRAARHDHPAARPRPPPFTAARARGPAGQPARHRPPWNRSRRRPAYGQHTCRRKPRPVTTRSRHAAQVSREPRAAKTQ